MRSKDKQEMLKEHKVFRVFKALQSKDKLAMHKVFRVLLDLIQLDYTAGSFLGNASSLVLKGAGVSTATFNSGTGTAEVFFEGGGGAALTVKNLQGQGGTAANPDVDNVNTIIFDNNSGFNVTDNGGGEVFVDLGSTFNP